jgi:hypothetical protein
MYGTVSLNVRSKTLMQDDFVALRQGPGSVLFGQLHGFGASLVLMDEPIYLGASW